MAVTVKVLIPSQLVPAAETTLFTATVRTIIDKFTMTNTDAAVRNVTVRLVPNGIGVGPANAIVLVKALNPNETYTFPEIAGHYLQVGDFISVLPTGVNVNCRSSGREIT